MYKADIPLQTTAAFLDSVPWIAIVCGGNGLAHEQGHRARAVRISQEFVLFILFPD